MAEDKEQDLSMEDILSSIKNILSEDEQGKEVPAATPQPEPVAEAAAVSPEPEAIEQPAESAPVSEAAPTFPAESEPATVLPAELEPEPDTAEAASAAVLRRV